MAGSPPSYQSLPVDQSEQRICEKRCLGLLNEMNKWGQPKYMIAEGDTYIKYPNDETFPQLIVNYVKLDKVPAYNEDWSPLVKAMRAGDYFVSTGEVLVPKSRVSGPSFRAEVEWTFPLEFVEVVTDQGTQTVKATDLAPQSRKTFTIPFNAAAHRVRFTAWDSAGNGAFTQPIHLKK